MDTELSDADLVRWIAAREPGAERAEAALYRRFAPRIELYGIRHLGSRAAAADLVQQVMLRVIEALRAQRLKSAESLASFVLGTCRLVTWGSRRGEQRQRQLARAAALGEVAAQEPPLLGEAEVVRLFGCMSGLPEREARVVRMSFWEDRPADEIGARLGLSAGNVRVIRHRAVVRLLCPSPAHAALRRAVARQPAPHSHRGAPAGPRGASSPAHPGERAAGRAGEAPAGANGRRRLVGDAGAAAGRGARRLRGPRCER